MRVFFDKFAKVLFEQGLDETTGEVDFSNGMGLEDSGDVWGVVDNVHKVGVRIGAVASLTLINDICDGQRQEGEELLFGAFRSQWKVIDLP